MEMNGELFKLSVRALKRRWRQAVLLFAVLSFSFGFAVMTIMINGSMEATNRAYAEAKYGRYDILIPYGVPEDREWLESREWLLKLGTTVSYGRLALDKDGRNGPSIGTVDQGFIELGHLELESGRWPEYPGEIAMEESKLDMLKLDKTLGGTVEFTIYVPTNHRGLYVPVQRSFKLVGIIREYADGWNYLSGGPRAASRTPASGAIITEQDAQSVYAEAGESVGQITYEENGETVTATLSPLLYQYHIIRDKDMSRQARDELQGYMKKAGRLGPTFNDDSNIQSIIGRSAEATSYYSTLILIVTALGVICIYLLRVRSEAASLARFRSLGLTKRQLLLMVFYETVIIALPAFVVGVGLAAGGTALALELTVYAGSVPVRVTFPWKKLMIAALLWLVTVVAVRLAAVFVSLRTPLTGRIGAPGRRAWLIRRLNRALIWTLTVAVCYTALLTFSHSRIYLYDLFYTKEAATNATVSPKGDEGTVPANTVDRLRLVEGVKNVWGIRYFVTDVMGKALEERDEYTRQTAPVYVIDDADLEYLIPFDDLELICDSFSREEFIAGDSVLAVSDSNFTLSFGNDLDFDIINSRELLFPVGDGVITARVGYGGKFGRAVYNTQGRDIYDLPYYDINDGEFSGDHLWGILCSESFFERFLSSMPEGQALDGVWTAGERHDYNKAVMTFYPGATYLGAAEEINWIVDEAGLRSNIGNLSSAESYRRDFNQVEIQFLAGGLCVMFIIFIVIFSAMALEAERERRSAGIMEAIGLSKSRRYLKRLRSTLKSFLSAAAVSMVMIIIKEDFYRPYLEWLEEDFRYNGRLRTLSERILDELLSCAYGNWYQYGGTFWRFAIPLGICFAVILAASVFAGGRVTRGNLTDRLRDEQ